jgi:hypothetical protein
MAAVAILLHFLGATGKAQLVQVRPGYVKAPFVRVYSYPDGSSYVRAPFVGVFSPGHRRHGYARPAMPTAEDLAEMNWRELRVSIRNLAAYLDGQLDTFTTGDLWKVHLKTAEIRAMVHDDDGPPAEDTHTQLDGVLRTYEATKDNPKSSRMASLESFQALHAALVEFSAPPEERLRHQLSVAATDLHHSLEGLRTGSDWQKYLAFPEGIVASKDDEPTEAAPNPEELAKVLQRFDTVSQEDQYRFLARLPAFRPTHDRLAAYVALLKDTPQGPRPRAEELPVPKPRD